MTVKFENDDQVDAELYPDDAYDTTYRIEQLPHEDFYREIDSISGLRRERPSLVNLHESRDNQKLFETSKPLEGSTQQSKKNIVKLGWCSGVMLRGVLSIIGTMLFLRHSWIIGEAGVLCGLGIIVVATGVCLLTSLSLSAIATNGQIKGAYPLKAAASVLIYGARSDSENVPMACLGGAYFLLSRTIGPEFGAAIGMILAISNCMSCALCIVGFAETLVAIIQEFNLAYMVDPINDVRIIGVITITMLIVVVFASIKFETIIMYTLLVILNVSLVNFMVGTFMRVTPARIAQGILGYSAKALRANLKPKLTEGLNLGQIYGIFFPSMTGVLAGVNISGNLKNPTVAIPRGTILALLISSFIYIFIGLTFAVTTMPESVGSTVLFLRPFENCTYKSCRIEGSKSEIFFNCSTTDCFEFKVFSDEIFNCTDTPCKGGLLHNYNIMKEISAYPPLLYAGIFAATLSSASASFVAGPKIFQALCKDNILPRCFEFFAVGHSQSEEPHRAYILCYLISCCLTLIGNLNRIAVLVAEFTMISYVLINYACFDISTSKSLAWRPSFRWYNKYLSFVGAVVSLISMFVMNWWAALVTFLIVFSMFYYVKRSKPNINWGSSTHAQLYTRGLSYLRKYAAVSDHVKNFRPQCLILTGHPSSRIGLVNLIAQISKGYNLAVCGNVFCNSNDTLAFQRKVAKESSEWLRSKSKFFYNQIIASSLREGVRAMMQCSGIGHCKPNILVMGFKNDWAELKKVKETIDYFNIIHDAFDLKFSVIILRVNGGIEVGKKSLVHFPKSKATTEVDQGGTQQQKALQQQDVKKHNKKKASRPTVYKAADIWKIDEKETVQFPFCIDTYIASEDLFSYKQTGFIDIWWIFDDGGLTVLLPYLLSKSRLWQKCKIRVFTVIDNESGLENQRSIANLLAKFRINYDLLQTVDLFGKSGTSESDTDEFMLYIKDFILGEDEKAEDFPWKITPEELKNNRSKTARQIQIRNALRRCSYDSQIIFLTMMIPRKGTVSAFLFMAWLDFISRGLPPVMFIRGNQESVLTFYS